VWKECVKPKDDIVVVGQDFMCEVEFSKKLACCSYESLFIAPHNSHIHPKELVLPKFQKPSFP
jgi:hypothetical protein